MANGAKLKFHTTYDGESVEVYVLEYGEIYGILNTFGILKIAIFARNQSDFKWIPNTKI